MLGIVGTVPDLQFPLVHGKVRWQGRQIRIEGHTIPVNRGTPALIAASLRACECIGGPEVYAFLVGDTGVGEGSRRLYDFLTRHLSEFDLQVLTFHYLQPDVDWHGRVLPAVQTMARRPILIADAGFMYAAKMSGQARHYDFFTPDVGELAFLADDQAPHPFYTRGFILHQEHQVPDLIRQAYGHGNAAACLVVKGSTDYIVHDGSIAATVEAPSCDAMEAIGGTGDTLTGLLSAFCGAGFDRIEAAVLAARANRWTGALADPTPATQVPELIDKIPEAVSHLLDHKDYRSTPHGGA